MGWKKGWAKLLSRHLKNNQSKVTTKSLSLKHRYLVRACSGKKLNKGGSVFYFMNSPSCSCPVQRMWCQNSSKPDWKSQQGGETLSPQMERQSSAGVIADAVITLRAPLFLDRRGEKGGEGLEALLPVCSFCSCTLLCFYFACFSHMVPLCKMLIIDLRRQKSSLASSPHKTAYLAIC